MRFGSGRTGLLQDSTGSVIVQDGHQDDNIQMQSLSDGSLFKLASIKYKNKIKFINRLNIFLAGADEQSGVIEHIIMAVYSIFQLIIKSSYLATNIIMMVKINKPNFLINF